MKKIDERLLKWCADEGWQPFPRKENPSGFARCLDGYIQRIRKADADEPPQTMTEPIVVETLNWAEEPVEEPLCFKGGIEEFVGSGKYEPIAPYGEPVSALTEGVLYSGENGMIICCKCAGVRESCGVDSYGRPILALSRSLNAEFRKMFGEDMRCERGCTRYGEKF